MVMDTLAHIEKYTGISPRIALGLDALRKMDFSTMEDGKHPIDGDDVFVLLSTYTTKSADEAKPEAHREYIDIQYLISGKEFIGVSRLDIMGEPAESFPERDLYFYQGKTNLLPLEADIFHLYFPQDAHAPCIAADKPAQVRKAVIKVRV